MIVMDVRSRGTASPCGKTDGSRGRPRRPADALVEGCAAFQAARADFQIVEGIVPRLGPGKPRQAVAGGGITADRPTVSCNAGSAYLYVRTAASKVVLNDFVSKIFDVPQR